MSMYKQDPSVVSFMWGVFEDAIKKDPAYLENPGVKKMFETWGATHLLGEQYKPHQFITIALPNDYSDVKLKDILLNQLEKYKWLKDNAICVVEKYGSGGHENLHLHILKGARHKKSMIIDYLSKKFGIERNFVNVLYSTKIEDYNNRFNYINGDKDSPEKMESVQLDKEWRADSGYYDLYSF